MERLTKLSARRVTVSSIAFSYADGQNLKSLSIRLGSGRDGYNMTELSADKLQHFCVILCGRMME